MVRTQKGTASRTSNKKQLGQGRPLGLLAHWLMTCDEYETQQEHLHIFTSSRAQRVEARRALYRCEGAVEFASSHEREKRDGEESEPEDIR